MKRKQTRTAFLNAVYIFTPLLILIDAATSFEIKNQIIKAHIYLGTLVLTPLVLIWN